MGLRDPNLPVLVSETNNPRPWTPDSVLLPGAHWHPLPRAGTWSSQLCASLDVPVSAGHSVMTCGVTAWWENRRTWSCFVKCSISQQCDSGLNGRLMDRTGFFPQACYSQNRSASFSLACAILSMGPRGCMFTWVHGGDC